MPTLINNILAIEAQATDLVAKAHADAEAMDRRAEAEIASAREKLVAETDAKLAELEAATQERCKRELAGVEAEFQAACAAIDGISDSAIREHAAKIAAAFTQG
ncbi:MAG: hypothetical protein HUU46_19580 [Candidatus Hydrogenedentes bacterium]|nr:hypothetical protein [Candidatus Hydrogenedentota bacterium]